VAVVLALWSAVVYGVADYCGGHATRRLPSPVVTCASQIGGLAALLCLLPILGDPLPPARDWGWGAAGGVAGVFALVSFYRALAEGAMTVVAPTTAVVSASVPVVVGLAQGERPSGLALTGVALALVAVALVGGVGSRSSEPSRPTPPYVVGLAVLAGLGFGFVFVTLGRASDESGMWPLVSMRVVSIPLAFLLARRVRQRVERPLQRSTIVLTLVAGLLDMSANLLYLLATRHGLLTVVGVVAALYPASTVALAFVRDGERVGRIQVTGLLVAAGALVLVGMG